MAGWEKKPCPWCDAPPGSLDVALVAMKNPPPWPPDMKFGDRRNSMIGFEPELRCKVCDEWQIGKFDDPGHVLFDIASIIQQRQENHDHQLPQRSVSVVQRQPRMPGHAYRLLHRLPAGRYANGRSNDTNETAAASVVVPRVRKLHLR